MTKTTDYPRWMVQRPHRGDSAAGGTVMTEYSVTVFLSKDYQATCMGFDPEVQYEPVMNFLVFAEDEFSACEVAYSVCNSYPTELHCEPMYAEDVERYRASKNRSLSVGDVVAIDGHLYSVAAMGFEVVSPKEVEHDPRIDRSDPVQREAEDKWEAAR